MFQSVDSLSSSDDEDDDVLDNAPHYYTIYSPHYDAYNSIDDVISDIEPMGSDEEEV